MQHDTRNLSPTNDSPSPLSSFLNHPDKKVRRRVRVSLAITMRVEFPELSQRQIAAAAGLNHVTLSRDPRWADVCARLRGVGAAALRRGRRAEDGSIEADDDRDIDAKIE
jgi:hypothetical protein